MSHSVLASSLCAPSGVIGNRVQESPTSADVSWRTVPGATGYIVTVTGSDGSSTAMIVDQSDSTTITHLDTSISYSVTVRAFRNVSDEPSQAPGPASNPITIAATKHPCCRPGRGYNVELRLRYAKSNVSNACDCSSITSDMLQSVFEGLIDTTECPDFSFLPSSFSCEDPQLSMKSKNGRLRKGPKVSAVVACDNCEMVTVAQRIIVYRWLHRENRKKFRSTASAVVSLCDPSVSFNIVHVSEKIGHLYCSNTVVNDSATCGMLQYVL